MTAVGTGFSSELSLDLVDLLEYCDGVQAAEASSQHAVDYHRDKPSCSESRATAR